MEITWRQISEGFIKLEKNPSMKRKFLIIMLCETVILLLIIVFAMLQKTEADKSRAMVEEMRMTAEKNSTAVVENTGSAEIEAYKARLQQAMAAAEEQRELAMENEKKAIMSAEEASRQKAIALRNAQLTKELTTRAAEQEYLARENDRRLKEQIDKLTKELEQLKKGNK